MQDIFGKLSLVRHAEIERH